MNLSTKAKANLAFLLALIALGIIGSFSFLASRNLKEKAQWVSHTHEVLETSSSLRAHLGDAGTARRVFLLGDPQQSAVFQRASAEAFEDFAELRQSVTDNPDQGRRLAKMEPLLHARLDLLQRSMQIHRERKEDESEQNALTAQGTTNILQFAELQQQFENVERELLQLRSAEVEVSNHRTAIANGILAASALLFFIVAITVLNLELTRRSKAELAIAEQRTLLRSIFDSSTDSIVVADDKGKVMLRNSTAERTLPAYQRQTLEPDLPAVLGFHKPDEVTPFSFDEMPLVRTMRGERVDGIEIFLKPEGSEKPRWLVATGRPLRTHKGVNKGGVVFYRDITDRKHADALLKAAYLESETTAKEKSQLGDLADLFQSCETLEEAYGIVKSSLPVFFEQRPGALYLTNASRNITEAVVMWGECSTCEPAFNTSDCWGLRLGKIYEAATSGIGLRCAHIRPTVNAESLCVPLMAQGEALGVLYVEDQPAKTATEQARRQILKRRASVVAERVSLALANLKLRETLRNQSIRDPLTGLFNRRYLEESLTRELHRASRMGRIVSLVMIDVDHFKRFNDTHGHAAGDAVLREVSMVMKDRVRGGDLACRYGGEEFAWVLPETNAEGAIACAESLRGRIKALSVQHGGHTLGQITISAGIASFPLHSGSLEALIEAADKALYSAKKTGRDRVVMFDRTAASAEVGVV